MGYESKLYIVQKHGNGLFNPEEIYGEVIAMFDMCKFYELSDVLREQPATNCYIYEGDEEITEDCYGDALTESSVAFVIKKLETILDKGEDYRRIYPLLSALKTFEERKDEWGELVVLHYGY